MNVKSYLTSAEVVTGSSLVLAGLLIQASGFHAVLVQALAPFGVGILLSDVLTRAGKAARERVTVRVRRDR